LSALRDELRETELVVFGMKFESSQKQRLMPEAVCRFRHYGKEPEPFWHKGLGRQAWKTQNRRKFLGQDGYFLAWSGNRW